MHELSEVFYREYCEFFKNIYFEEHLRTPASEIWLGALLERVNQTIAGQ